MSSKRLIGKVVETGYPTQLEDNLWSSNLPSGIFWFEDASRRTTRENTIKMAASCQRSGFVERSQLEKAESIAAKADGTQLKQTKLKW